MKKIIITLIALLGTLNINAQTDLWITGTAVPGGTQKLEKFPNGQFKFAGTLNAGELKVITTETIGSETDFLAPRYADSYIVNKGLIFVQTHNSSAAGWIVPFSEDRYKFTIDTSSHTLKGEIFVPWREVYLAGGACEIGWSAFVMLPFTQDEDDPNVFTWTGELREGKNVEEPRRIKLQGQNTWGPKSLHPYTQDEGLLTSTQMRHEGDDTKWEIAQDGIYRLTVNVFKDTFKAEYLGNQAKDETADIDNAHAAPTVEVIGHTIRVKSPDRINVELFRVDSLRVGKKSGTDVTFTVEQKGIYVLKAKSKRANLSRKIAID